MSFYLAFLAGLAIGWILCAIMTTASDADDAIEESSLTVRRVIRLDDYRESPKVWEVN